MVVDRSSLYGSRNFMDQHRDMRLDVDSMSYEVSVSEFDVCISLCFQIMFESNFLHEQELLALGERIGSVNTGLRDDQLHKCLTETVYCSSDQVQEEGRCVICLVLFYSTNP